jgi:NAD(P)-dependent dehydrogenase (short-subunit alcohol dehydrogenase family)
MRGRVVLVTGAGSGIGLAAAVELARRGFQAVAGVRSAAGGRQVAEAAAGAGVAVRSVRLDVDDPEACRRVVDRLRPYGLVNSAGRPAVGAIEDVGDEEARAALETMVVAPMRLARLALPHMREQGGGRIVNLSSVYGFTTTPLSGWYQASKHALEALSDALRMELAATGVRVVLVEPGGVDTGLWDRAAEEMSSRQASGYGAAYQRAQRSVSLYRPLMADPAAVGRVVARAVAARRPRSRYLVGYDARALALYERAVPTLVKDRLARLGLGL